jgi:hypothetical protein
MTDLIATIVARMFYLIAGFVASLLTLFLLFGLWMSTKVGRNGRYAPQYLDSPLASETFVSDSFRLAVLLSMAFGILCALVGPAIYRRFYGIDSNNWGQ